MLKHSRAFQKKVNSKKLRRKKNNWWQMFIYN
jgi:hypothetical protein